jgi:aryl-alcohol dehydrogenase-like predicted oxidoreductase
MEKLALPGTDLTASRLCLGGVPFGNTLDESQTFALLDRFFELGGNFVDTARIYSDWVPGEKRRSERILGDWIRARGLRDRMVVSSKGAHPLIESLDVPRSSAADLRDDLEGSLRALRVETIDLYWLHRDDPTRPAGHFIDLLNTFVREGKIRAFGASNWTVERLRAADAHADATGQRRFAANQPLWCLGSAQSGPPPFRGYVKFDPAMYRWHRESGRTAVPYTAQANGFFSKLARPPHERPASLAASEFHVPANLATADVVNRIASAHGVSVAAVVLAFLWSRPFPVLPIVGCRTLDQLEESAAALALRLSPDEVRALDDVSQSGLSD